MGEGDVQGGQTVVRHCAMHPFDGPKKRDGRSVSEQYMG